MADIDDARAKRIAGAVGKETATKKGYGLSDIFGSDAETGASMLLEIDKALQEFFKQLDELAEEQIEKLPERNIDSPDVSCEAEGNSAIRVSLPLKALHIGACKIVYRVLPRVVIEFIETNLMELVERVGIKAVGKLALKEVTKNFAALAKVLIGSATELDYQAQVEKWIHESLGCKGGDFESQPMRAVFNEVVSEMQTRVLAEKTEIKKVRTRRYEPRPTPKPKRKRKRTGKNGGPETPRRSESEIAGYS